MKIEVNPKTYIFRFIDDEHYDEGDNSLSLSEEQFKKLLLQMCNIADDEDLLEDILKEVGEDFQDYVRSVKDYRKMLEEAKLS